jgi:U3 small nucleolar RNA-associated protein 7
MFHFQVYTKPAIHTPFKGTPQPPLYLTHPVPHRPLTSARFCPYQDVLTVGHGQGLSSILVPGAGEPNFDSAEADPFENKNMRREREVHGLLDKVRHRGTTMRVYADTFCRYNQT